MVIVTAYYSEKRKVHAYGYTILPGLKSSIICCRDVNFWSRRGKGNEAAWPEFLAILGAKTYHAVGLMSGTSADGIDAAYVEIHEKPLQVKLKGFEVVPHSPDLKSRIQRAFSPITPVLDVGELNMLIGKAFAHAALHLLKKCKVSPDRVDFIGSHGQTIYHQPPSHVKAGGTPFTLQLGDGNVIAQTTGILTVSDFRVADMAQGGEGAPLVPYFDWRLFSHPKKNRVLLNIGGIANFTYLPAKGKLGQVVGSDTGPGNVFLDSLVTLFTHGKETYDHQGTMASRGNIREDLLHELLTLPFFSLPLPKSAERGQFGMPLAEQVLRAYGDVPSVDVLATATAFTTESILQHLAQYAPKVDEVFVSGGGVKNATLMAFLKRCLSKRYAREISFLTFEDLGLPSKAKEAVAFAFLAHETLKGTPSNVPNVTGAKKACVLGKISQGWRKVCRIV